MYKDLANSGGGHYEYHCRKRILNGRISDSG